MEQFKRKGHEGARFFIGGEVEHTPAFNKKTLFVVGLQDTNLVMQLAEEHGIKHIFLSANRSFDSVDKVKGVYMVGDTTASSWEKQILILLASGYMVSLDYPAHKHSMVLEILHSSIWQSRNFIPVLSVAVPHVNTSNINLTIKIDDSNFGATNPGVWCLNHHEITDSNRFTAWSEYTDDKVIDIDKKEEQYALADVDISAMDADDALDAVTNAMKAPLNQPELGLDPVVKSALKVDPTVPVEVSPYLPMTPEAAYADGTVSDKLADLEKDATTQARLETLANTRALHPTQPAVVPAEIQEPAPTEVVKKGRFGRPIPPTIA